MTVAAFAWYQAKKISSLNNAVDRSREKIALDMPLGELVLAEHKGAWNLFNPSGF